MSEDTFDIMQFAEETASEGGRARPMTCRVKIDGGYVTYLSGLSPQERFFSAEAFGRDDAKEMAKKVGEPTGAGYSAVIRMSVFKDSVLDRDVSHWKYDTIAHDYIVWQSSYTEVFKPSLDEAIKKGFVLPTDNWVRLEFVPDPYKPKRDDGSTNLRAFIAEFYPTRNAAADALGIEVDEVGRELPAEPAKWSSIDDGEGSWERFFNSIIDTLKENPNTSLPGLVVEEGGVTLDIIIKAKALADDESLPF